MRLSIKQFDRLHVACPSTCEYHLFEARTMDAVLTLDCLDETHFLFNLLPRILGTGREVKINREGIYQSAFFVTAVTKSAPCDKSCAREIAHKKK